MQIIEDDIDTDFNDNYNKLNKDIEDINKIKEEIMFQIAQLKSNITRIESKILNLQNSQNKDPAIISKLYSVLASNNELLNSYYSTLRTYLDTKFKYRQESNSVKLQLLKLKKPNINPDDFDDDYDKKNSDDIDVSY